MISCPTYPFMELLDHLAYLRPSLHAAGRVIAKILRLNEERWVICLRRFPSLELAEYAERRLHHRSERRERLFRQADDSLNLGDLFYPTPHEAGILVLEEAIRQYNG